MSRVTRRRRRSRRRRRAGGRRRCPRGIAPHARDVGCDRELDGIWRILRDELADDHGELLVVVEGGGPERGNAEKIVCRHDARAVGWPRQNGELADNATSSHRCRSSAPISRTANSGSSTATWTCKLKLSSRRRGIHQLGEFAARLGAEDVLASLRQPQRAGIEEHVLLLDADGERRTRTRTGGRRTLAGAERRDMTRG
jgi:hypothetical protein